MPAIPSKLIDDCFVHDGQRMRHDEALTLLASRVPPVTSTEMVPLSEANGRIVGATAIAKHPVPAHTNAAVDGYAFAEAEHKAHNGADLRLSGRAAAGRALDNAREPDTAIRIFTGATIPPGYDTVAMQEDVTVHKVGGDTMVSIPPGLKRGANVRKAGEDVSEGQALFSPGHRLRATDIAALASIGMASVECRTRLRVAILSTGDEIIRPGEGDQLTPGKVYDANGPMLKALLDQASCIVDDNGIIPDNPANVRAALAAAAQGHDLLLTTGGTSRGEEDHIVSALQDLGKCHLWQLAIKPGRPMSFGQIGDCVVIGLPGNPVAVLVCFLIYVWPLLARLSGAPWPEPRRYALPAAFSFSNRKQGRREFWRGILVHDTEGKLALDKYQRDGSGLISGLRAADGLIDIAEDRGDVAIGDLVDFIPFSEFGILGRP